MNMKSVQFVIEETRAAMARFPLAAALCAAACVTAWSMIGGPQPEPYLRMTLLMTFGFGAALFYALALVNERFPLPAPARPWHLTLAGALFLVFFYFRLAGAEGLDYGDRFAQWAFVVIMLVPFAPYIGSGEPLGMWQFDRRLAERGVVSAVYTAVSFAGLSLALAAVDKLLGVKVDDKAYQYLWSFAGLVFWPLHFMGATPGRPGELASDLTYPRGLKLFTQYVLLPLASVYFLILYAYMAKILVTQQWPQGWVSWLTSSASVLGLVAFLLLYPVSDLPENRWIRTFSRGFCAAALPLLLMLFAAVYKRVAQYGFTEHRYFLIALGLWLAGIFLYFLFSRRPDIRRVPMTLAVLAAVTSAGPWGAYSVGLSSQSARLERLLAGNGLLAGGKAVKADRELPAEVRQGISGALEYILRYHGPETLRKYFPPDHPALAAASAWSDRGGKSAQDLMSFMGQAYVDQWVLAGSSNLSIRSDRSGMALAGYDRAVVFRASQLGADKREAGYRVELEKERRLLRVFRDNKFLIDLPLAALLTATDTMNRDSGPVEQARLMAEGENGAVKVRAYFSRLSLERKPAEAPAAYSAEGLLLIKGKK